MCIIITNLESSAKMLSFNEVEGGPLVSRGDCLYRAWIVRGDRLFRDRWSRGTIYSQHKRSGRTNSGGGGGTVSSMTYHYTGGKGTKEKEGIGGKEQTKGRAGTKEEREGRSSKEKG